MLNLMSLLELNFISFYKFKNKLNSHQVKI